MRRCQVNEPECEMQRWRRPTGSGNPVKCRVAIVSPFNYFDYLKLSMKLDEVRLIDLVNLALETNEIGFNSIKCGL